MKKHTSVLGSSQQLRLDAQSNSVGMPGAQLGATSNIHAFFQLVEQLSFTLNDLGYATEARSLMGVHRDLTARLVRQHVVVQKNTVQH